LSDLGVGSQVIGYGSVRFEQAECEFTAFSSRPVLSADLRNVKWIEIDFTLKFIVGQENQDAGMTTDLTLSDLRAELERVGLELHVLNVGSGAVQSAPGGVTSFGLPTNSRDIFWGPVPQVITWKPFGDQAAECTWRCVLRLPPCEEDAFYEGGILEWCWRVNWSIDGSGYTTRNTSGFARVVGARPEVDSLAIVDQADRLREQLEPAVPAGFRRTSRSFQLSDDKARLDYSFTDEEAPPNVPPPGVVECEASHTLTTDVFYSTAWKGTLSASYEVARDQPRSAAYPAFLALVNDRIGPPLRLGGRARALVYRAFEMSEPDIYGRRCAAFRLEYTFTETLANLLRVSKLWQPVGGANGWANWSATMNAKAWHVRGNAGMKFLADDDEVALIDICEDPGGRELKTPGRPTLRTVPGRTPTGTLKNEPGDPKKSWLQWFSSIRLEQRDETIPLVPLPQKPPDAQAPRQPGITRPGTPRTLRTANPLDDTGGPVKGGLQGSRVPPTSGAPRGFGVSPNLPPPSGGSGGGTTTADGTIVQRRAPSTFYAVLYGYATRAGYQIVPPALREVGGAKATPANRPEKGDGVSSGILAVWFGLPIYYCTWQIRYLLDRPPLGELPVMTGPFEEA
jgi:hypothetical protein